MITITENNNQCDSIQVFKGKRPGWYGIYEQLVHYPIIMFFGQSIANFNRDLIAFGNEFLPEHLANKLKFAIEHTNESESLENEPFPTFVSNVGIGSTCILVYRVYPHPEEFTEELDVHECAHLSQHILKAITGSNVIDGNAARELQAILSGRYYHVVRGIKRAIWSTN